MKLGVKHLVGWTGVVGWLGEEAFMGTGRRLGEGPWRPPRCYPGGARRLGVGFFGRLGIIATDLAGVRDGKSDAEVALWMMGSGDLVRNVQRVQDLV